MHLKNGTCTQDMCQEPVHTVGGEATHMAVIAKGGHSIRLCSF